MEKFYFAQQHRSHRLLPRARSSSGPRFQLLESTFDRDSEFETPITVFILHVQRYDVTSGLTTVGGIEQREQINTAAADGACSHSIVAVIQIETNLCRRGRPRGHNIVFLRKN